MAIFTGSFNLGVWAGATGFGMLAKFTGYEVVFVATGITGLAAAAVFARSDVLRDADAIGCAESAETEGEIDEWTPEPGLVGQALEKTA